MEVPDFVGDAVTAVDERAAPEVADAIDARKRHTDEDDDAKKKIIPHFHRLSLFSYPERTTVDGDKKRVVIFFFQASRDSDGQLLIWMRANNAEQKNKIN